MKPIIYLNLIVLLTCFLGCDDGELERKSEFPEYMIFGHFYGECTGEQCIEIYKLQNDSLFKAEDIYPWLYENELYDADFHFFGNNKLSLVADLIQEIPKELLETTTHRIGCPDCTDQGGFFIEYSTSNFQYHWSIDKDRNAVPNELHEFLDLIDEKIILLRE